MLKRFLSVVASLAMAVTMFAQSASTGAIDRPEVSVGRGRQILEGTGTPGHPYRVEAFHSNGVKFYEYTGWNLRTTAGTNWQADMMSDTSTPSVNAQCNYIALTNTAVTPAEADTSLSGEIVSNGLSRAQATYTNVSTTLAVPSAATAAVVGTTGAVTYDYWVAACNQGICTTPSAVSNTVTTANATLSTTNYDTISFTGQNGASSYQIYRTTSGTPPSGTVSDLVAGSNVSCSAALACIGYDQSNTLTSVTIPASNVTNLGKLTLVHTWTATGTQSAQAFGVLTAASSGTMCFEGTFTSVSLNNGDTFQLTESVFF